MLHSCVIRTMDDLGRIVIPKIFREKVGAKCGDSFELHVDENNNIVLSYVSSNSVGALLRRIENELGRDNSPEASQIRHKISQIWEILNRKKKSVGEQIL